MSTSTKYVLGGTVIQCDTSKRPRPRPRLSYPIPVFAGTDHSLLVLQLQAIGNTGRCGVLVTSAVSPLPGGGSGQWTLFWVAFQGQEPTSPTWKAVTVTGAALSLLLSEVMPASTFVAYLQRVEAGQTYTYARATISIPRDDSAPPVLTDRLLLDTAALALHGFEGGRYVRSIAGGLNAPAPVSPTPAGGGVPGPVSYCTLTDLVPCVAGDVYALSGYAMRCGSSTGGSLYQSVWVLFRDANGNILPSPHPPLWSGKVVRPQNWAESRVTPGVWNALALEIITTNTSTWVYNSDRLPSYAAPDGAVSVEAAVAYNGLSATEDYWYDRITLTKQSSLASPNNAGSVAVGAGLQVDAAGVLSHAPATASSIGGIKVGSGLSVDDDGTLKVTGGSGTGGGEYDISIYVGGCPVLGETILRLVATRAFALAAAGHQASCGVNPTAAAVFTLYRNGVACGTLTISTAGLATFALATSVSFAVGDLLTIIAPSPQDLTLADVGILLAGSVQ